MDMLAMELGHGEEGCLKLDHGPCVGHLDHGLNDLEPGLRMRQALHQLGVLVKDPEGVLVDVPLLEELELHDVETVKGILAISDDGHVAVFIQKPFTKACLKIRISQPLDLIGYAVEELPLAGRPARQ
eukprot:8264096-Lingulodinium_polyedra.AAC.1